jgi:hypothetical protein
MTETLEAAAKLFNLTVEQAFEDFVQGSYASVHLENPDVTLEGIREHAQSLLNEGC